MTIHSGDPFATPEESRSPVRRLRGRLPAAVTLWTAVGAEGAPAGLTVSSTLVVDGEPGLVLGVVDAESSLWEAIGGGGRFVVAQLRECDRRLADAFAGVVPAPGGPFAGHAWRTTPFGPVLADLSTWVGCQLVAARPCGWGLLVEATAEQVELGQLEPGQVPAPPLVYYRGRYRSLVG